MVSAWEIKNNKPKVLIGIPHRDLVMLEWAVAFRNLDVRVPAVFTTSRGTPVDMARNSIVESAMQHDVEYLLFIDSDVCPPKDALIKLMKHNLPIVSGVYYTRSPPIEPCFWNKDTKSNGKVPIKNYQPGSLIKCDFVGAGCLLIHMSVFKHIEKPYFKWTLGDDPNDTTKGMSEDFYFCEKCRKAGYSVIVDTSVQCRHEISNAYTTNDGIHISEL